MRATLAMLTLLAAAGAGCSKAPPASVDPMAPAFIRIENQSFSQMTIYAIRGSVRIRLGQVMGNSSEVFELPRSLVNVGVPIRFMADPLGSNRTSFSQEIGVGPGDTVSLRIPPP